MLLNEYTFFPSRLSVAYAAMAWIHVRTRQSVKSLPMYVIKSLDYRVLRQRDMNVDGALAAQRSKSLSGSFTRAFSKYICIIVLLISMGLLDSMINDVIWVCRRHGAACCCAAGLVYALGGFDGQTVLNSAERFDPARRGLHDSIRFHDFEMKFD